MRIPVHHERTGCRVGALEFRGNSARFKDGPLHLLAGGHPFEWMRMRVPPRVIEVNIRIHPEHGPMIFVARAAALHGVHGYVHDA